MKKYKLKIKGLDCANCANELESALSKIDIIDNVGISFMSERLSFECLEEVYEKAIEMITKVINRNEPDVTIEEL